MKFCLDKTDGKTGAYRARQTAELEVLIEYDRRNGRGELGRVCFLIIRANTSFNGKPAIFLGFEDRKRVPPSLAELFDNLSRLFIH